MSKADKSKADVPLEGLVLECQKDRYKLSYAALRWAKEIKQKENLPDPIPVLVQRALREILTGKVSIKEIEKLPMISKSHTSSQQQAASATAAASTPTLTLNVAPAEPEKPAK